METIKNIIDIHREQQVKKEQVEYDRKLAILMESNWKVKMFIDRFQSADKLPNNIKVLLDDLIKNID